MNRFNLETMNDLKINMNNIYLFKEFFFIIEE